LPGAAGQALCFFFRGGAGGNGGEGVVGTTAECRPFVHRRGGEQARRPLLCWSADSGPWCGRVNVRTVLTMVPRSGHAQALVGETIKAGEAARLVLPLPSFPRVPGADATSRPWSRRDLTSLEPTRPRVPGADATSRPWSRRDHGPPRSWRGRWLCRDFMPSLSVGGADNGHTEQGRRAHRVRWPAAPPAGRPP